MYSNSFLELIDIKIERSHSALVGNLATTIYQIEPIRPGYVFFLGFIFHVVQ